MQKKAKIVGLERIQEKEELFSSKEKDILYEIFGVSSLADIYESIKCVDRAIFNSIESEEIITGKNLRLKRGKNSVLFFLKKRLFLNFRYSFVMFICSNDKLEELNQIAQSINHKITLASNKNV